jgi:hypothetical protein
VTAGTMAELRGEGESKRTLKEVFFQAVGEKGDAAS